MTKKYPTIEFNGYFKNKQEFVPIIQALKSLRQAEEQKSCEKSDMDKILDIKIDVHKKPEDEKQNKENLNTLKNEITSKPVWSPKQKSNSKPTITLCENYHQTTKFCQGQMNLLSTLSTPKQPVPSHLPAPNSNTSTTPNSNKMKPESIKLEQ